MAEDTRPGVRLLNKAAHVKHISVGNGESIAVPPTPEGTPGTVVKFDSDKERQAFEKAIKTPAVKVWIDAGELEVKGGTSAALPTPTEQSEATRKAAEEEAERKAAEEAAARTATEPARVSKRETSRG